MEDRGRNLIGQKQEGARAPPDYVSKMVESKTREGDRAATRRRDGVHEILYTFI